MKSSKKRKKVAVIVPAHNEEKYIRKCLFSLIKQKCEISEIVVVLDRCTDNTEIVVRKIAEKHNEIRIVKKETTKYRSIWRAQICAEVVNWGINNLIEEPDYLMYLDADTVISPNYIFEAMQTFEKKPNCAIARAFARAGSGSIHNYSVLKKLTHGRFVECEAPDSYILSLAEARGYNILKIEDVRLRHLRTPGGASLKARMLEAFRKGIASYKLGSTPPYVSWRALRDFNNPLYSLTFLVSYSTSALTRQSKYKPATWQQNYQKARMRNKMLSFLAKK